MIFELIDLKSLYIEPEQIDIHRKIGKIFLS